ncbi:MAG: VTT domain-containing protein [Chloroflexi bacterium]|nr:VTT domain-containing protein [Chloroflexota bacterium]
MDNDLDLASKALTMWVRIDKLISWFRALPRFSLVILIFLLTIAIAALGQRFFRDLTSLGYLGVLIISFIGTSTIVLPAPSWAAVFAAGALFNPFLVAVMAALGEATGELTGYLLGYGGKNIVEKSRLYSHAQRWMQRRGLLTVFLVSVIPNPVFDMVGVAAGAVRFPVWKFFLVCVVGKFIKSLGIAFLGGLTFERVLDLIQRL